LYPRSRGFKLFAGSWFERLHKCLAVSEAKAFSDATAILWSILPDNDKFTASDATDWERRLGLITNPSVSLADRKLAILRKMNHPGTIKARQHYLYIQGQLQNAGFNVFVYENLFPDGYGGYYALRPEDVLSGNFGQHGDFQHGSTQHGDAYTVFSSLFKSPQHGNMQHGDFQHNQFVYTNKIVNYIEESFDAYFNPGLTMRSTFFVGGNPLGSFATVPLARKNEFRQLLLKLKPVQSCGFLFINYA
jgi:hypothetical protein